MIHPETPYTPINHCVRSYRPCQRVLGNKIVRREGTQLQCRKRDNVEKEGNQQVTWVMPVRERVLRVNEDMICESASVSSLLKLFQVKNIITSRRTLIEKHSRRQNGSREREWQLAMCNSSTPRTTTCRNGKCA